MRSFSFGSVSGTTFAFCFFLLIALFVGVAICRLLQDPRLNRVFRPPVSRFAAWGIGVGAALTVFLGVYFSSLDGFYHLEIDQSGQEVHLEYILPNRTLKLSRSMIAEVRRVPVYKNRWQLELYTPTGERFASARADYASTRQAWEYLNSMFHLSAEPWRGAHASRLLRSVGVFSLLIPHAPRSAYASPDLHLSIRRSAAISCMLFLPEGEEECGR